MQRETKLGVAVLGRDAPLPPFNLAVFASGTNLVLVRLEDDAHESAAAEAVARGYEFIGSIGVNDGVPKVALEPGHLAASMMPHAGTVFAGMLGKHLRDHQRKQVEVRL
jgi:hypothetical protein